MGPGRLALKHSLAGYDLSCLRSAAVRALHRLPYQRHPLSYLLTWVGYDQDHSRTRRRMNSLREVHWPRVHLLRRESRKKGVGHLGEVVPFDGALHDR